MPSQSTRKAGEDRAIVELIGAFLQDQAKVVERFEKRIEAVATDVNDIKDTQNQLAVDQKLLAAEMKVMAKAKEDQNGKLYKTISRVDEIEKRNTNHDSVDEAQDRFMRRFGHVVAFLLGGGGGIYLTLKLMN